MAKFESGQRVNVLWVSNTIQTIKNQMGIIHKRNPYDKTRWWVKIDGEKGFSTQEGCWSVLEDDIEPVITNNKEAKSLLSKEF